MLPSWIRSRKGSPKPWYRRAIDTTSRRLDSTNVRFARSPCQGIHSRYDRRWKTLFPKAVERPAPSLLDNIMKIGDCPRFVTGDEQRNALAMLEIGPSSLVGLRLMRLERNLNGVVKMLHGDKRPGAGLFSRLSHGRTGLPLSPPS